MTDEMPPRRLTRSETDRLIGGVCGGLAEYLQVDATLVRIGFVVVTALGGAGVVLYLALWLLVPAASRTEAPPRDVVRENAAEGRRFAEDTAQAAREAWQRMRRGDGRQPSAPDQPPAGAPPDPPAPDPPAADPMTDPSAADPAPDPPAAGPAPDGRPPTAT